jgi:tetratricopeptide (TPR) repeat protein
MKNGGKFFGERIFMAIFTALFGFIAVSAAFAVPRDAERACRKGDNFYNNSQLNDALAEYEKALKIAPDYAEAWMGKGNVFCWGDNENLKAARECFDKAAEISPKYKIYADAFGYQMDKNNADAGTAYAQCIKENVNTANAYSGLGISYYYEGNIDQAIATATKGIQLYPKFYGLYENRGAYYRESGDAEKAIADYTKAMALNRNDSLLYVSRGSVYLNTGEIDNALADFNEAIRRNPDNKGEAAFQMYYMRGLVWWNKGDAKKTMADFDKAVDLNPEIVWIYPNRAFVLGEIGEYKRAIADYDKALEMDPENQEADSWKAERRKLRAKMSSQ